VLEAGPSRVDALIISQEWLTTCYRQRKAPPAQRLAGPDPALICYGPRGRTGMAMGARPRRCQKPLKSETPFLSQVRSAPQPRQLTLLSWSRGSRATISGWVGRAEDEPNVMVTIEDRFSVSSDASGKFEFRLKGYRPPTCIVAIRTEKQSERALSE